MFSDQCESHISLLSFSSYIYLFTWDRIVLYVSFFSGWMISNGTHHLLQSSNGSDARYAADLLVRIGGDKYNTSDQYIRRYTYIIYNISYQYTSHIHIQYTTSITSHSHIQLHRSVTRQTTVHTLIDQEKRGRWMNGEMET